MPVHDAPTHASTVIGPDWRYGCHSTRRPSPVADGYMAPDKRILPDGRSIAYDRYIKHAMSNTCRYDRRPIDPACADCRHESDVEYLKGYGL